MSLQHRHCYSTLRADLHSSQAQFLTAGGHKVGQWMAQHHCERVAFFNANALVELDQFQRQSAGSSA